MQSLIRVARSLMASGLLLIHTQSPNRAGRFQRNMLDDEWVVKANCRSTDKDYFFEKYEEDQAVAVVVDNICLTCPVIIDCFNHGTTNAEVGGMGWCILS